MKLLKHNLFVLVFPVLLFSLGFITLLSTSPERAKDQFIFFLIGIALYFLASAIDFTIYKYYWKLFYVAIFGLLTITFIMGEIRLGSARWLDLGFFTLQPSEFAKIILIISLASFLAEKSKVFDSLKDFILCCGIILVLSILVLLQPDLGTTLVFIAISIGILFYAGLNKIWFIVGLLLIGIFSTPLWNILHDYQKRRILVFLNPSLDIQGAGYNVIQSVIAVGSGGLFGKGFGHGTQSHLNFLPAHWTDFIFASFAEEWGFVGVAILLTIYLALLLTILYISTQTENTFGSLIVIGVFMVFFTQFVINVGMNLGVMPVTGIPLPLISYGGSSMLTSMILLGIVQSVWINTKKF